MSIRTALGIPAARAVILRTAKSMFGDDARVGRRLYHFFLDELAQESAGNAFGNELRPHRLNQDRSGRPQTRERGCPGE